MNLDHPISATPDASIELLSPDQSSLTIQPLAQRSMFWRPAYLDNSAWLEHIPFAFWLVEAQRPRFFVEIGGESGVSYFSFCQAVDKLGLDTKCFSIGGLPAESSFDRRNAYNQAQYSGFSRLVRGTSDEALPYFADRSIDLLHLDGQESYETACRNFQLWLPKLSQGAIVIIHGTNPRDGKLGVSRFFEALRENHLTLEFPQGHGLGVISIGPACNDLLQRLFDAAVKEPSRRAIYEVFSRLGRACADSFAADQQTERNSILAEEVERQKAELTALQLQLGKAHNDFEEQSRHLSGTITRMQTQLEQKAVERGQLSERVSLLQEIRLELKEETRRYQDRIASISAEFTEKNSQLAILARQTSEQEQTIQAIQKEVTSKETVVAELTEKLELLQDQLSRQSSELERARSSEESLTARLEEMTRQFMFSEEKAAAAETSGKRAELKYLALHQQFILRENEVAALKCSGEEHEIKCRQLKQALDEQTQRLDQALVELQILDQKAYTASSQDPGAGALQLLERQITELQAEKEELAKSNQERFQEIATITRMLVDCQQAVQEKNASLSQLQGEQQHLSAKVNDQTTEIAALARLLGEREAELQAQSAEAATQQQHLSGKLNDQATEIAALARLLGEREAELQAKGTEAASQAQRAGKLAGDLQNTTASLAALEKRCRDAEAKAGTVPQQEAIIAELEAENSSLRSERQVLQRKLNDRFRELATLTTMFVEREQELEQAAAAVPKPLQHRLGAPFVAWQAEYKKNKIVRKQLSIIEKSGLFDEAWYLRQYPDVAAAENINACEHYLRFGAAEGRNPGPAFNTRAYEAKHPEVRDMGINPLLHFIQHEKK